MHAPVRKLPIVAAGAALAAFVLTTPALAGDVGIQPVTPQSPNAQNISNAYWFITAFVLAVFVVVETLLVVFVVRYRRRKRQAVVDGPQIHGSTRLETMWTLIPVVILFAVATFVFVELPGILDVPGANAAGDRVRISVRGEQFSWQFRYPNGAVAFDRMRVPVGEPVELTVTAPNWDVIHSWWIPALGGKIDAIPGRVNHTWFSATKTGVYTGSCAELCGVQHAAMLMSVEVMPRDQFDQWVSERADQQRVNQAGKTLGQEEWAGSCAKCHGLAGQGGYGPPIAQSPTLQDKAALTLRVRQGLVSNSPSVPSMPPVGKDWTQEQIDALYAYTKERFGGG
jgi:cytochrome c oxidase subunit II